MSKGFVSIDRRPFNILSIMNLKSVFPIIESFQSHTKADWRKDIIAGLTVAIMLVPQGMAYSFLAGMPPIYGLYAGLIPLILYAVLTHQSSNTKQSRICSKNATQTNLKD